VLLLIKLDTRVPGGGELHSERDHHIDRQLIMDKRYAGSNRPTHSSDSARHSSVPCRCSCHPVMSKYTNKCTNHAVSSPTNQPQRTNFMASQGSLPTSKQPATCPILSQVNRVHASHPHVSKIHFNIILSSTPRRS
jgi:hypothetical protein